MQTNNYEIRTTLNVASMDDFGNSIVESTQEVFHFDKITEEVAKLYRASKPLCSCDALHIKDEDNIYLIEFKNTRSSNVPKKSLKQKAFDSIMTLQCAFFPFLSIEDIKQKVTFIFVYNNAIDKEKINQSEAIENMKKKMYEMANRPKVILYDLEIYKDVFYKDIYTVDKTEFENNLCKWIFA